MHVHGVRVGELTPEVVQALADGRAEETLELEFKRDLPGTGGDDAKEFLADVSSFANSAGGAILYGIEDERDEAGASTGRAQSVAGIASTDSNEKVCIAIANRIGDGLAPRLAGVVTQVVSIEGKRVLAIGIPRSLLAPHMVSRNGRFYRRRGSQRYALDVYELRAQFNERDSWEQSAEQFRFERLNRIQSREVDRTFRAAQFVAIHVLPLGRLRDQHDVFRRGPFEIVRRFAPAGTVLAGNPEVRGSLEGPKLVYSESGHALSWLCLLRNGGIEYICARAFARDNGDRLALHLAWLPSEAFVEEYILTAEREFGVSAPFVLFVSICGASGAQVLDLGQFRVWFPVGALESDEVHLPGIAIESADSGRAAWDEARRMIRQAAGDL